MSDSIERRQVMELRVSGQINQGIVYPNEWIAAAASMKNEEEAPCIKDSFKPCEDRQPDMFQKSATLPSGNVKESAGDSGSGAERVSGGAVNLLKSSFRAVYNTVGAIIGAGAGVIAKVTGGSSSDSQDSDGRDEASLRLAALDTDLMLSDYGYYLEKTFY